MGDGAPHPVWPHSKAALPLVFFAVILSSALAQEPGIVEAPPEVEASPKPARKLPSTLGKEKARTPDEIVAAFFDLLKADKVEEAYKGLVSGTVIEARGEEAQRLRDSTQQALDAYGPVSGAELVREEKVGGHLIRRTYLLLGEVLPLRWKFYFYETGGSWKLIDLRVDDALVELFDESGKPAK